MAGLAPGMSGGHQHRGNTRLRIPVAVAGPIEQLGRGDALGDEAHKAEFDVTGTQHRSDGSVVETRWWLIKRVPCRQHRAAAAPQVLMRGATDPLGAKGPIGDCHVFLRDGNDQFTLREL
jgi:hypothetical protein